MGKTEPSPPFGRLLLQKIEGRLVPTKRITIELPKESEGSAAFEERIKREFPNADEIEFTYRAGKAQQVIIVYLLTPTEP